MKKPQRRTAELNGRRLLPGVYYKMVKSNEPIRTGGHWVEWTRRDSRDYMLCSYEPKKRPELTLEEAVTCLNDIMDHFDELCFFPYYRTALEMAAEALLEKRGH